MAAAGFPLAIVILSIAMLLALGLGVWLIYRVASRPGSHMAPPQQPRGERAIPDGDLPDMWEGRSPWPLEPGQKRHER